MISVITILERILIELLNNAYKYTAAGETITVLAHVIQIEDSRIQGCENDEVSNVSMAMQQITSHLSQTVTKSTISHFSSNLSQFVDIVVCNTGIELSASEQNQIFNKFYRIPHVDPWNHGGTGLGLSLVKCMAEYLGGTIQVKSENNVTQFTLKLPIDPLTLSTETENKNRGCNHVPLSLKQKLLSLGSLVRKFCIPLFTSHLEMKL